MPSRDTPSRARPVRLRLGLNGLRLLAVLLAAPASPGYAFDLAKRSQVNVGSVYSTLYHLEQAGLVSSHLEEIDPVVAGRPPRRYYLLTVEGAERGRAELTRLREQGPWLFRLFDRFRSGDRKGSVVSHFF